MDLRDKKKQKAADICNQKLRDSYYLLNITIVIRLITVGWVGNVARMRKLRNAHKIVFGKHVATWKTWDKMVRQC
jgi:hypothetical protein